MATSKKRDRTAPTAGLSPHTVETLIDAGEMLARRVRHETLHSPRPVFLYYIAQTFDTLTTKLSSGKRPRPTTPAQQLCLHLMIAVLEEREAGDSVLAQVRSTLMPEGTHESLAAIGRIPPRPDRSFDFVALGDTLYGHGMGAFFAPFESDDMVA
ncbi:hypothetical protein [Nocardia aurea]|uniref:Uncharacterized protein n=1 Tax=Nocardia aurea TaxID=2144174 RepID=A0ABV3G3A0_9NOCA